MHMSHITNIFFRLWFKEILKGFTCSTECYIYTYTQKYYIFKDNKLFFTFLAGKKCRDPFITTNTGIPRPGPFQIYVCIV